MGLKRILERTRNYFSRRENEPRFNDERGRNAQVGYQQRRSWFDKALDAIGSVVKYIGLGAVALTGVGAIALGAQYLRGSWPYKDVRANEFVITQNAITEKPARPLRQGVRFFVPPFVRVLKEDGKPVTVPGTIQSAEIKEFPFRSLEGAPVRVTVQYNYQVTTPEGAAKVFWDYGGLESAARSIDTIVEGALMTELALVPAKDVTSDVRTTQDGRQVNFLIEAENKANAILGQERAGIVVTNFAISKPRYTEPVEAAWEAPIKAEAMAITAQGEANARRIRAGSEAYEAEIQAGATGKTMRTYFSIANELATAAGQPNRALDIATELQRGDNAQQIATSSRGRIVLLQNPIAGAPPINIQNVGQANKPEDKVVASS